MKTVFRLSVITLAIAMAGCASYRPYSIWNDGGFSEQEVQPNRFRVRFTGNDHMELATAEDLAMLRAAELCMSRQLPFVELSSIHSELFEPRISPRYLPRQFAPVGTVANNAYSLPWASKTTYIFEPKRETRESEVPAAWLFTPISDLTATCESEPREGVADAAELAKRLRTLHADRLD